MQETQRVRKTETKKLKLYKFKPTCAQTQNNKKRQRMNKNKKQTIKTLNNKTIINKQNLNI